MASIEASAKNVRSLLGGKKYTIDYFQREYRWQTKQIEELVRDLTGAFLAEWRAEHGRDRVASYPAYFLGSIIISNQNAGASVIDGQQRLTSLSILLIWVMKGLAEADRQQISDLIFTRQFGANSYNLDVKERTGAMDALYRGIPYNPDDAGESVRNILGRYDDIEEHMPDEIAGPARPMFADWLIERVFLVQITSPTDDDGYAIFETMNDRGLPLSPTDMLKSHLLANVSAAQKLPLNETWKARVNELMSLGREEEADAIKSWLRAKHAATIRPREANAQPGDFDRIGSEFHRWVRERGAPGFSSTEDGKQAAADLGLKTSADFERFVKSGFDFYTRWYLRLRQAEQTLQPGREIIYFNATTNFTLQYPMMLAPLRDLDEAELAWRKIMIVATFIDIMLARRMWNLKSIDYNTMQYAMFLVIRDIREKGPADMVAILKERLEKDAPAFAENPRFGLNQAHKKTVRRFLVRLHAWLDERCGTNGTYSSYLPTTGALGQDIEHLMPDNHAAYSTEFPGSIDFYEHRNQIGGLLLLPRSFNRSYGGTPYEQKLGHYLAQNRLAQTLHHGFYDHNPAMRRVVHDLGIPFEPFAAFGKEQLGKRQATFLRMAEAVWNPARLDALLVEAA